MKINITYESGPAREGNGSVDYMIADISDLDLDQDELYAEVDPYSFLHQMGGTDKICEMYPEYEETIREYDPYDMADLEALVKALECKDRDFNSVYFWDKMIKAFLWEADQYTWPYLEAEIIAQAEALGIDKDDLVF